LGVGPHHSNVAVLAVRILLVVYGAVSIIAAITVYRHWMSTVYKDNKNRKIGFGAISGAATEYRTFVGASGAVALTLGFWPMAKS
jgi:hypothetical protein